MTGIQSAADYLSGIYTGPGDSICGLAVCGRTRLGSDITPIYAGMVPLAVADGITLALTEEPGGPSDPRQIADTYFDNPSFTLHIIGDDLVGLDAMAQRIREQADRRAHIATEDGIINGMRIGPPRRTARRAYPRWDVQMAVDMEIVRRIAELYGVVMGPTAFDLTDGLASITSAEGFAAMGFTAEALTITETD